MAMDFDAMRVNELFKDETRKELKNGITARDINSVVGLTPMNKPDLHEALQQAYKLIYDSSQAELNKYNTPITNNTQQNLDYNFVPPTKTLAEQLAEQQQKSNSVFPANNISNDFEVKIKEKDSLIETLTKERDEAINKLYELEKHHTDKYKELNEKYENLKDTQGNKPSVIEDISDDLLDYLKDKISRMEQKEAMLNQEIGKLKGMLGM